MQCRLLRLQISCCKFSNILLLLHHKTLTRIAKPS
jgi:hypothetical protein